MSNKHNDEEGKAVWEARKKAGDSRFWRFTPSTNYHPPHKNRPQTRQQRYYATLARITKKTWEALKQAADNRKAARRKAMA